MTTLEKYITQVRGISYNPQEISNLQLEGYIPVLKANNITDNGLAEDNLIYIHKNKVLPEQFIKKGDLLLAASSGSREIVGKHIFFHEDYDGTFGAFCKVVRPNKNIIPSFLSAFFKTPTFRRHINKVIQGANINNLRNEHLNNLLIPEIPISEQIKIATILDKTSALIKKRKESIDILDEFLNSTFIKMFGNPLTNTKSWTTKKFGDCVSQILSGSSSTNAIPKNSEEAREAKILKVSSVTSGEFKPDEYRLISWSQLGNKLINPQTGDLLFSRANTRELVAATCIVDMNYTDLYLPDKIWVLFLNQNANQYFIHFLFQNELFKKIITKEATGSSGSMLNISMGKLRKISIPVPPIEIQNEFKEIVIKTWLIKKLFKSNLQDLKNLYDSLSRRSFRRELNLSKIKIDQSLSPVSTSMYETTQKLTNSKIQKVLQTANSILANYEKVTSLLEAASQFNKYFETWNRINENLKMFSSIPSSIIEVQQKIANIQETFNKIAIVTQKGTTKVGWEKVSSEQVAKWIKEKYNGFHFNCEMVIRYLQDEHVIIPNYYSSEELKKNPQANEADDLKSFIFSASNKENGYLRLEQIFYNAEIENFQLNLTKEDFELIKDRLPFNRSGIYFTIIE